MKINILFFILSLTLFIFSVNCQSNLNDILDQSYLLGLGKPNDFERPNVLTVAPYIGSRNIEIDQNIKIIFSRPMNKQQTIASINLNSNGGNTNYRANWDDDITLSLNFPEKLTLGKRYELRINRAVARDTSNNFMSTDFISHFYTVGFESAPFIEFSDPPISNSITFSWPIDKDPTIQFSDSMDTVATNSAVTITGGPAVFLREWSDNNRMLRLRLLSDLEQNVNYRINISSSALNTKGLTLDRNYQLSFFTGQESELPEVSISPFATSPAWDVILPIPSLNTFENVSKFDNFRFVFNNEMNRQTTESAISFNPGINGQYLWITNNILEFRPTEPLNQDTLYRLNFNNTATDILGNLVRNSYRIDFRTNNPLDSLPVEIVNIRGYSVNNSCIPILDTNPNAISYPIDQNSIYSMDVISTDCAIMDYMFEIQFNTSNGCALATSGNGDIFNQVSFSYFAGGPGGGSPSVFYKEYNPPAFCSIPGPYRIGIKSIFPGIQYKASINGGTGGVNDINRNHLINSKSFLIQRL